MAPDLSPGPCLLFLCTGNYYRSRFAELLFNALAQQAALSWTAESRALALERGLRNVGPMSPYAAAGLTARGVVLPTPRRSPIQVQEQDFQAADLIIALSEAEHRGLVEERFPQWPTVVEYWHIDDLNVSSAEAALAGIEAQVKRLLTRLA